MSFAGLEGYLADDGLVFPPVPSAAHPAGKAYRVPSPDHKTGVRLTAFVTVGVELAGAPRPMSADELEALPVEEREARQRVQASLRVSALEAAGDDGDERLDWMRMTLGPAYGEMSEDGVSWLLMQRMGRYALLYFTLGEDAADDMVRRSAEGNPPAPNREERRAAARGSRQASSGTATSTPSRGSTSGTTSRRKRPAQA